MGKHFGKWCLNSKAAAAAAPAAAGDYLKISPKQKLLEKDNVVWKFWSLNIYINTFTLKVVFN